MIMSKLITNNFKFNRCLLTNVNELNLFSLQKCCFQDKIRAIKKNMIISEKILIEINDKFLTIYVTNCFLVINDLLLFYRSYELANNMAQPYIDSLLLQTQVLVGALSELKIISTHYTINSPEWIYILNKIISRILLSIVSTISKLYTLELQTCNGTNRIILLPCKKCLIEKNQLINNITLLEKSIIDPKNIIITNSLVVLISNLNLLVTMINCQCNVIINNLVKVVNDQIYLFLKFLPLVPLLPNTLNTSIEEIFLRTMKSIVQSVQDIQILISAFNNIKISF